MIRSIAFIVGITRKHDKLSRKLIEIFVWMDMFHGKYYCR